MKTEVRCCMMVHYDSVSRNFPLEFQASVRLFSVDVPVRYATPAMIGKHQKTLSLLVVALIGLPTMVLAEDLFVDVTEQTGLDFVHYNAATEEKYMVETMGSGAAFFNYDGDGFIDIYVLNGAPLPGSAETSALPVNALYWNQGDGTFLEVATSAGVAHTGYGMGATAGDIDNDGDVDLYVTNFGPNVLYINNGDGTFTDGSSAAGVEAGGWSTSAAFGDYDGDGFLDLFVCRYVDFSLANHKFCGNLAKGLKAYCHPEV